MSVPQRRVPPPVSIPGWSPAKIRALVQNDAAHRVLTVDALEWLDPYTGTTVPAPFGFEDAAVAWLQAHHPFHQGGKSIAPKPLSELLGLRWFVWLRAKLPDPDSAWMRQFLPDGRWLNPFNGRFVSGVERPGGQITLETARLMAIILRDTPQAQSGKALEHAVLAGIFEAEQLRLRPVEAPALALPEAHEMVPRASSTPTAPAVRVVKGYRVIGELGSGGMSTVYRATQLSMDRQVALKVLDQHGSPDPAFIERFVREAHAVGRINHPHVVTCFDVGFDQDRLYMAMELMTGGDAAALAASAGGRLPEGRALSLIHDVSRGLGAVHAAGLIHRDIKPANIFITAHGSAKLGDLGLCRDTIDRQAMELTTDAVGTPAFMSPEQAMGHKDLDIRSDIYALGACLFALLAGRSPFVGDTVYQLINQVVKAPVPEIREVAPEVSEATALLIKRAMAKDRDRRHQTPLELETALARILSGDSPLSNTRIDTRLITVAELWAKAGVAVSERNGSGATHAVAVGPDGPVLCAAAMGTGAAGHLSNRLSAAIGTTADPLALTRQLHADGLTAVVVSLDPARRTVSAAATSGSRVAIADAGGDIPLRLLPEDAHSVPFGRGQVLVMVAGRGGSPLPLLGALVAHADRPAGSILAGLEPLLRDSPAIVLAG